MTHDELARDLAMFLSNPSGRSVGYLTWENIEIGPDRPNIGETGRPDVYAIGATLSKKNWRPTTYEVKVSVADFQADIRQGKWRKYRPYSAYIVFAVERGLLSSLAIPDECGLIVRDEQGWHRKKRGRRNDDWTLTERQWMNLCLKGRNPSPWENKRKEF